MMKTIRPFMFSKIAEISFALDLLSPLGMLYAFIWNTLPLSEKKNTLSWESQVINCFISLSEVPVKTPFPPLFCAEKVSASMRLIRLSSVRTIVSTSCGISSSSVVSTYESVISVFLESPYFSLISSNSSTIRSHLSSSFLSKSL